MIYLYQCDQELSPFKLVATITESWFWMPVLDSNQLYFQEWAQLHIVSLCFAFNSWMISACVMLWPVIKTASLRQSNVGKKTCFNGQIRKNIPIKMKSYLEPFVLKIDHSTHKPHCQQVPKQFSPFKWQSYKSESLKTKQERFQSAMTYRLTRVSYKATFLNVLSRFLAKMKSDHKINLQAVLRQEKTSMLIKNHLRPQQNYSL